MIFKRSEKKDVEVRQQEVTARLTQLEKIIETKLSVAQNYNTLAKGNSNA